MSADTWMPADDAVRDAADDDQSGVGERRLSAQRAARETGENVSALIDRVVQQVRLAEAVTAEAAWYAVQPGYAEEAEAERRTAGST